MEEAIALFKKVYQQNGSTEVCIAELKRMGFTQMDTIRVLMEVSSLSVVEADEIVHKSLAWSN
ncbi:hypothetical protein CWM47_25025 [Spirosoma pollinicola]|uniref:Uncharacterized protein n=1 Tax=Spirosoma pollinicola TaxID=2057025 RepID=A0A2K8Z4S1_9BACT|nr:hypothetical protein CWM47_25025 [Spirosoma pollinicola]